ncbi:RBBP9/YdeN family alpha/beta hydrolase [Gryllotalpicola koreensis]|uniref:Hydrolase n=1 Tax=Gryllotalpicola koreensis TaxID=993086 RepID=A0ABP8ABS2_9MICO
MGAPAFLILHGWENHRPVGHWQRRLHDELVARGHTVRYPQLPDADAPRLEAWLAALHAELEALDGAESVTVICHSLACALWLHAAQRDRALEVDRLLLASAPAGELLEAEIVAEFAFRVTDAARLGAREALFVSGDADPYCPAGPAVEFADALGAPVRLVPGGGHLTIDDGYGPWPDVLSWCVDGAFPA